MEDKKETVEENVSKVEENDKKEVSGIDEMISSVDEKSDSKEANDGSASKKKIKKEKKKGEKKDNNKNNKTKVIVFSLIAVIVVCVIAAVLVVMMNNNSKTIKEDAEVKESAYRLSGNSLEDFDLYFLQLENEVGNKVYSPLSIKYALAMLNEGTAGTSNAQIKSLIGDYKANKYTNNANMSFANALFIRNAFKDVFEESYKKTLSTKYNAEVIYDSFESAGTINSWISDRTFKLIENFFNDSTVQNNDFVLVNALAIDMEWNKLIQATTETYKNRYSITYDHENYSDFIGLIEGDYYKTIKFNNETVDAKVVEIGASINNYDIVTELGEANIRATVGAEYKKWLAEGGCGYGYDVAYDDVDTFLNKYISEIDSNYGKYEASTDFMFYVDDTVKVFAKDLKEYDGTTLQYVGIMPTSDSLENYINTVTATDINKLISSLKDIKSENFKQGAVTTINGYIPLFNFEYELDLMNDLKKLGITDIFDINKADLSGIVGDVDAVIGTAAHKATIEFSNEGIKAAAATGVGGMGSAGCWFEYKYDVPVEEIDLTFDNPYLFLIRDKDTGEVWFTGTVYQPLS